MKKITRNVLLFALMPAVSVWTGTRADSTSGSEQTPSGGAASSDHAAQVNSKGSMKGDYIAGTAGAIGFGLAFLLHSENKNAAATATASASASASASAQH